MVLIHGMSYKFYSLAKSWHLNSPSSSGSYWADPVSNNDKLWVSRRKMVNKLAFVLTFLHLKLGFRANWNTILFQSSK